MRMMRKKCAPILRAVAIALLGFNVTGAAAKTSAAPGAVVSVTEITTSIRADGAKVVRTRRISDVVGYFAARGVSVVSVGGAIQDTCLETIVVTPGGNNGGGGGAGGGGTGDGGSSREGGGNGPPGPSNTPPANHVATANTLTPPASVTNNYSVTSFSTTVSFADGWSYEAAWNRNPGNPPGAWFLIRGLWNPPHGINAHPGDGSVQEDCLNEN